MHSRRRLEEQCGARQWPLWRCVSGHILYSVYAQNTRWRPCLAPEKIVLSLQPPQRTCPVLVIAHRGASGECPENTLAAFQRAIELGADMLECDVQCSRDGTVVVMHDARVSRTTNGHGLVRCLTWRELKQLDAGAWFGKAFQGERLPTLEDVLTLTAGKVLLNIEIKRAILHTRHTRRTAEKVAALVARSGLQDTILVSSFDPGALAHVKACQPALATALITMHRPRGGVPAIQQRLDLHALHVSRHRVSTTLMTEAHRVHCPVHAFTVDEIPEMRRLIAAGVDGLFTNYPGRLRRLLATMFPPV
jgi:glycerophosphoryl diester phosphodiesterase